MLLGRRIDSQIHVCSAKRVSVLNPFPVLSLNIYFCLYWRGLDALTPGLRACQLGTIVATLWALQYLAVSIPTPASTDLWSGCNTI